ncbi:MAG TPA: hypothetical protein VHF88_04250, partial [Thermoleophilaceae bacterium]|nr:hypothetical protein [Thermoleophilaceae bacterium]
MAGTGKVGRRRVLVVALALMALLSAVTASQARAAFGDLFGLAPVNGPGLPASPVFPATAGVDHAFWAGTCDVGSAPFGPIAGGVGSRP